MSPLDESVQSELNSASAGFYSPHKTIAVGQSEEITLVRYAKWADTKYPIKDKAGQSLGYTWRFWLEDGRVWDVSNRNRKVLLQGLHLEGKEAVVPGVFRITNIGRVVDKQPALKAEYVGPVGELGGL